MSLRGAMKANERRVADRINDGVVYFSHGIQG
jgi:hypothetical protein